MRRMFAAIFCIVIVMTGCTSNKLAVNVKFVNGKDVLYTGVVNIEPEKATAEKAILAACEAGDISYTNKDGMYDGFSGVKSTETDGWILYVNDKIAQTGAAEQAVVKDDMVEMRYVNYNEVFAMQ